MTETLTNKVLKEEIAIRVRNLKKTFGSLIAVNDINFTVKKQEILGILGPNGAGKTTTIRLITGIYPLSSESSIEIFEFSISKDILKCKAQFGIVPEISNAFLDFTVEQNISFAGRLYGLSKKEIEKRSATLLHKYNLTDKKQSITKSLSKGLKQRLNFCMALIHDPMILILDEPTSGLDPISVKVLREQILELRNAGKTILLTTHDMQEAQKLCDRVLIINHGKIIVDESPDSLRERFGKIRKFLFKPEIKLPELPNSESSEISESSELLGLKKLLTQGNSLQRSKNGFYRVTTNDPALDTRIILDYFKDQKIPISDIKLEEVTLEDIFIEIIENGKTE